MHLRKQFQTGFSRPCETAFRALVLPAQFLASTASRDLLATLRTRKRDEILRGLQVLTATSTLFNAHKTIKYT